MPELNNLLVIYDNEACLELAYITQPLPFNISADASTSSIMVCMPSDVACTVPFDSSRD